MADMRLTRSSPLGPEMRARVAAVPPGPSPIVIAECENFALCAILSRTPQIFERFKEKFGFELPSKSAFVRQSAIDVISIGPNQWLARSAGVAPQSFARELSAAVGETASVFDQTDGRAVFRLSGRRAREALSKGVLIDLHPSAFGPGDAASTTIAYMSVVFWQIDDQPTYEIAVFRSFAESLWHWLVEASENLGVEERFADS